MEPRPTISSQLGEIMALFEGPRCLLEPRTTIAVKLQRKIIALLI
jgi:hypothetical protein